MSSTNPARRVLAALAVLTVLGAGVAAVETAASASAAPADSSASSPSSPSSAARAHRTTVTLKVPHCEGCEISPAQGIWDADAPQGIRTWNGPNLTVEDGQATFTTASRHLHGMSFSMSAPWERRLGYVTNVAVRYRGHAEGDRVTTKEARRQRHGTACWAGTSDSAVTLTIVARRARVEGVMGRTTGTIAFLRTTPDSMPPMRRVYHGVMGSQDLNICGRQPQR